MQPAAPSRSGCSKPLLIGCAVVFVLAAIAAIVGFYLIAQNANALLQWSFRQMEKAVTAEMPTDVTAEERERFKTAMAELTEALKEKRIDPASLQPVQMKFMSISGKGKNLTRQDVLELTEVLEQAVATASPPGASSDSPSP